MKKLNLRGCGKIFRFVLTTHMSQKSYIALTLIVSVLLFGAVFAVTLFPNLPDNQIEALPDNEQGLAPISRLVVYDTTITPPDSSWLSDAVSDAACLPAVSLDEAQALSDIRTLIVVISAGEDGYYIDVLRPDNSELSRADAADWSYHISSLFREELYRRAGIDPSSPSRDYDVSSDLEFHLPAEDIDVDEEQEFPDDLRGVVEMIVSILIIFIMYFMVLLYGQTAAGSVMLEKTSKLMDFFLVSVDTASLMLGKVLAISVAAIIQVTAWIASAAGGWWIGSAILRSIVHDASAGQLTELFSQLSGLFSPVGIAVALLCIVFGFILYCGLAAIGGALASKPEDLSSTNGIFTMALVISYLMALFSGTGMVSDAQWLVYFPFTAILVTPGRALTGSISPLTGIISAALVAVTAFVVILLAGKVYTLMAFYRGNPPKLSDLPKLLKSKK